VKAIKERDPEAPDTLSWWRGDQLGATSRQRKRMTMDGWPITVNTE